MQVQSLGWEDALEKDMATHSSVLAWKIPWTEEPGGLQSIGSQRVRHDLAGSQTTANTVPDRWIDRASYRQTNAHALHIKCVGTCIQKS